MATNNALASALHNIKESVSYLSDALAISSSMNDEVLLAAIGGDVGKLVFDGLYER